MYQTIWYLSNKNACALPKNIKLPVNIPPIIAQTPVKKCINDLKKTENNYKTLIASGFFVT